MKLERVDYEQQKGGNEMIRLRRISAGNPPPAR
jgi:hypothetical protein